MESIHRIRTLVVASLMLVASPSLLAGQGGWQNLGVDIAAGMVIDDNITRAERDFDILDDTILGIEAAAANTFGINDNSYIRLHGAAVINRYQDFDGLNNNRIKLNISYFYKPVLRFTAIEYFLRARYELRMFDTAQREGDGTSLSAGIRKRLTDVLSMSLAYTDESIDAEEQMFDTEGSRINLDFNYVLSGTNSLYLTLSRYDGDVLSTINPVVANSKFPIGVVPFAIDRAYPRPNASLWWWTYRLDGSINALTLGGAFALDHNQGLDLSVYYFDTQADRDSDYSGLIYSLYYSYRF